MSVDGFSQRLRRLRNQNDWTVQEMAEKTGLPKRTLDKYMLKEGASQPGLEAIVKIAQGLEVSLDWLLLGEESHALSQSALVQVCTRAALLPYLNSIMTAYNTGHRPDLIIGDGKIMGQTPDNLAREIANAAAHRAEELAMIPATQFHIRIAQMAAQED